jgi:AraC-like DNA-binding protein
MDYYELPPCEQLQPYVQCYWVLEHFANPHGTTERILPDGTTELLFHFGHLYKQLINGKIQTQPRSFFYGQLQHFIEVQPAGSTGIIGVRFKPHGFSAFTSLQASELTHQKIHVSTLFGAKGNQLEEQIYSATSNQERISLLRHFLIQQLKPIPAQNALLTHSIELIQRSAGQLSIGTIAQECSIGYKAMERLYQSKVGLSPKQYARIIRFQSLFKHYSSSSVNNFTELAYAAGYYDQAHFIRDFKHFSGVSPATYFNGTNTLSDLLTLPKDTV